MSAEPDKRPVAIIGAPLDLGQGRRGVDMGPSAIRYAGLEARLNEIGVPTVDWGNVGTPVAEAVAPGDEQARFLPQIKATCEHVAELVVAALEEGYRPLVLGGDHSVALGSLGGLARFHGPGGVLWIDAHGDLNRPETSPSGNVHGMVLAAVLGLAGPGFESDAWPLPAVDPSRVALVGVRQLDQGEKDLLRELGATVFPMSELDRIGVERAVRESLARIAGPGLRARQPRPRRARPGGRAGRRHAGARRPLVPRGAPRARARRRVGARGLVRPRRGEPDPRPRERDGAARGRAGRERLRRDDSVSVESVPVPDPTGSGSASPGSDPACSKAAAGLTLCPSGPRPGA